MEIPEIVVSAGLVTGATVVLSFLLNQGYAAGRKLIERITKGRVSLPPLGEFAKKAVVAGVALGLTGYSGLSLLPAGSPPEALLAYGTAVFKASQFVYDRLAKGVFEAK